MRLSEISSALEMEEITDVAQDSLEVKTGYVSDLLSDVMANAEEGSLWITLQTHLNIIAVATMRRVAGILIVNGRRPDEETVSRARAERVPIFITSLSAFEAAGRLYRLLHA
ncbi:MAG: serine kinase [Nitrospirae bacterium]|nr:MAG: serine kinase [Nitrospirota bacterium]